MSFRCDYCGNPQPSGSKPILQTPADSWRDRQYTKIDPDTNLEVVVGLGKEAIAEFKTCRTCMGLQPEQPLTPVKMREFVRMTSGYHAHAQKCQGFKSTKKWDPILKDHVKENIPCRICELIVKDFAAFPPKVLSEVLEDQNPNQFKTSLCYVVVGTTLDRASTDDNVFVSKNTVRSNTVALGLLKHFTEKNPNFIRS